MKGNLCSSSYIYNVSLQQSSGITAGLKNEGEKEGRGQWRRTRERLKGNGTVSPHRGTAAPKFPSQEMCSETNTQKLSSQSHEHSPKCSLQGGVTNAADAELFLQIIHQRAAIIICHTSSAVNTNKQMSNGLGVDDTQISVTRFTWCDVKRAASTPRCTIGSQFCQVSFIFWVWIIDALSSSIIHTHLMVRKLSQRLRRGTFTSRLGPFLQTSFHFSLLLPTVDTETKPPCYSRGNGEQPASSHGAPLWCTLEGTGLENQWLQQTPKISGSQRARSATHALLRKENSNKKSTSADGVFFQTPGKCPGLGATLVSRGVHGGLNNCKVPRSCGCRTSPDHFWLTVCLVLNRFFS